MVSRSWRVLLSDSITTWTIFSERQINFIRDSAIPLAMVGLLTVFPTALEAFGA
ncbi:MAG: hypothetical protein IPG22_06925 [Acidobacteria bacterium]|nr:hypothetical protein [Acidobacteriota bacterium]